MVVIVLAAGQALTPAAATGDRTALAQMAPLSTASAANVERRAIPSVPALRKAWRFARRRGGDVSIAVVDTRGRLRGRRAGKVYVSASVVKAMLLAAELRRLERDGAPLDPGTEGLLRAMICHSDNDAADAIYLRVGDAGLLDVARLAGLRRFAVAGHWTTAADNRGRYGPFLLAPTRPAGPPSPRRRAGPARGVVEEQSWGVPRAAGKAWAVFFKGGWRATGTGELVHQAALLRHRNRRVAIAVLTDGQPSQLYGIHTVRGVADRLLDTERDH